MNSLGELEFAEDGREEKARKYIQQHAFFSQRRQIAGINANLYTIYSSGRPSVFFSFFSLLRNGINSTFCD